MIFDDKFWAGNDSGAWKRPLNVHVRGSSTDLNTTLHTTQNYSIAVGKVAGAPRLLGWPAGQQRVVHDHQAAGRRAGDHG